MLSFVGKFQTRYCSNIIFLILKNSKMTETILKELAVVKALLITTQKAVLNLDELSAFTGLSKSSLYKFTHKGIIPHYKQAKHLWFDRLEIEKWLKENRGYNLEEADQQAASALSFKKRGGAR